MAKVNNLFKNQNIEEASEYLEANGYYRSSKNLTGTMFIKDDKAVLVYADKVSFREYNAQHDDIEFAEFASFDGINILSTVDWIYLFHITGIVPLKQFLNHIKKENISPLTQTNLVEFTNNLLRNIKTMMLILFLTISLASSAQISLQLRGGSPVKTLSPFFAPAVQFKAHNISLQPEMIVYTNRNAPAEFGVRLSYQYKFIEAGAGRYFDLYSTDAYDKYKNGWQNMAFITLHYKSVFLEYDYQKQSIISAGIKTTIGYLQN